MSEEIPLRILFPKFQIEETQHSFNVDKDSSSILEYVTAKYPDQVPASSQLFMANEQRTYTPISPDEQISSLDLRPQHQILIIPESYELSFVVSPQKTQTLSIRNNYTAEDILKTLCVQNQLLHPKFYQIAVGSKILETNESITEQAPFATSLSIQIAPPQMIYEILIDDFVEGNLYCTQKEMYFIIAYVLLNLHGSYKNTNRTTIEKDIKNHIPKNQTLIKEPAFIKATVKAVTDVYKKMKPSDTVLQDINSYIMSLQHFGSMVANGERNIGPVGKRSTKDKATFSLNYSIFRVFKQNSIQLLEEYNICDMKSITKDGAHVIKFEYDMKEGKMLIRTRFDDAAAFYEEIIARLKTPDTSTRKGGKAAATQGDLIDIPPFIYSFNLFSELPKHELVLTNVQAALVIAENLAGPRSKYVDSVIGGANNHQELSVYIRELCSLMKIFNEAQSTKIFEMFSVLTEISRKFCIVNAEAKIAQATAQAAKKSELKKLNETAKSKSEEADQLSAEFTKKVDEWNHVVNDSVTDMKSKISSKSLYSIRPFLVHIMRSSTLFLFSVVWLNEIIPCRQIIDTTKEIIIELYKQFSTILLYSDPTKDSVKTLITQMRKLHADVSSKIKEMPSGEQDQRFIDMVEKRSSNELDEAMQEFEKYFSENPPIELVVPLTLEINKLSSDEPRPLVKKANELCAILSKDIDDMKTANDNLFKLRQIFVTMLGMANESTHEPLVISFNDFKNDIERNFSSNGGTSSEAAAKRCKRALDAVFQSMNPAQELKQQLSQFQATDPRVVALIPIIDYLDSNGPLYNGSSTHVDIQRFIGQMQLGKTATLVEIAFTIESYVPENLRHLTNTCDPCRDLYPEIDGELEISDLSKNSIEAAKQAELSAIEMKHAIKKAEREATIKYRTLNIRLWRIMNLFGQFAAEESPGSIGHEAFHQCRDAFKTLIEEASYDMKRDRLYMTFIDDFTKKVDAVIESPQRSETLSGLGAFLLMHQTRAGFYKAAKALSEFNHYVLCVDSNRAAEALVNQSLEEMNFRKMSLMVASLRTRFNTLLNKTDLAMKTKVAHDNKHSDIDLRGDFQMFLKKFTDHLFIIFSQLVVNKSQNQEAIQSLSTGCDAIEKLLPEIMNIEIAAPYLARSVCGIVFSSLEGLLAECKVYGGQAALSGESAFLAVREFLFNVRRKIADSEREKSSDKTGIGIKDMLAVIDRDNKMINEAVQFQQSLRKRKWGSQNLPT